MNTLPSSLPLSSPDDRKALWDNVRQLYERTATAVNALTATGVMGVAFGSTVPAGALSCNGAAVNRATYNALFSLIGTTYGAGDGLTTFNLPSITAPVAGTTYFIWT